MSREVIPVLHVKELFLDGSSAYPSINANLKSNGTANVSITNVAPAGVTTATISAWLPIYASGTVYYIPCWT
jgi:hypothetical protein